MAEIEGYNVKYSQLNDEDKKYVLEYLYTLGSQQGKEKFYQDFTEFQKEESEDYIQEIQRDIFKTLNKYK